MDWFAATIWIYINVSSGFINLWVVYLIGEGTIFNSNTWGYPIRKQEFNSQETCCSGSCSTAECYNPPPAVAPAVNCHAMTEIMLRRELWNKSILKWLRSKQLPVFIQNVMAVGHEIVMGDSHVMHNNSSLTNNQLPLHGPKLEDITGTYYIYKAYKVYIRAV